MIPAEFDQHQLSLIADFATTVGTAYPSLFRLASIINNVNGRCDVLCQLTWLMGSFFARRKLALFLLVLGASVYLFTSRIRRPTPISELSFQSYVLLPPQLPKLAASPKVPDSTLRYELIPSFFVTSPVLGVLLLNDAHYARILSDVSHESLQSTSVDPVFKCVCGRVSDDCVCCGILSPCPSFLFTSLPTDICAPLVLFHSGDNIPATLCLNATYLPLKQRVRSSGFLIPTSISASSTFSLLKGNMNQSLVLFDKHYSPLISAPDFCVENSKVNPEAAICIHFTNMKYSYDSVTDHTTTFTGCAEISIVLKNQFIISKYPRFCFRAHRGAIGDVDQAEQVVIPVDLRLNISSTKMELVKNDESHTSSHHPVETDNPTTSTLGTLRPVVVNVHDAQAVIP